MEIVIDVVVQIGLVLLMIIAFLFMNDVPRKTLASLLAYKNRSKTEAKRHFVRGAQLYAQAKNTTSSKSLSKSLAKQAEDEADKAISLNPKDAASHILKALALDQQGFKSSALDSLDVALSPLAAGSLSDRERGDALFKRAEVVLNGKGGGRKGEGVDSAIRDLTKAVELSKDNAAAFYLLGECYEGQKMVDEAKKAYEAALKVQPELDKAKEALARIG